MVVFTVYLMIAGLIVGFWEVIKCKTLKVSVAFDSEFRERRFKNLA